MHPRPTENETHTPPFDLNRGMTAGMDRVDVNAHLDDTGISHGTKQGLMRVNGRDRGTSQACLETQERKAHWNSTETPRESDKLSPRNQRKNSPRFQNDQAQTESTHEQKTPPYFDSQKLMEMMMKEFFYRQEEDWKWEKKEKPDSA